MADSIEYYCVGFWYGGNTENQLPRFIKEGIWENGFDDKYLDKVKNIPVGSMLAAKTSYTRKQNGKTISVLQVHGIGKVTANPKDGKLLKVDWQKDFKPFKLDGRGAYRSTISKVHDPNNIALIFGKKKKSDGDALSFDEKDLTSDFPLNQILYGPPGTGKTYYTINKAVSIIDNLKEEGLARYFESRKELKDRFDELIINDWQNPSGQIGFVTFHQSMSYEDFVEGIKPGFNKNDEVIYDVEAGIFKKMAEIARDNWLYANKETTGNLSFEEAFQKFKDEWYDNTEMKIPLTREGSEYTVLGFSKSSIKFKKASGGTGHTLSISTLRDYYYQKRKIHKSGVGIYYPGILDKLNSYKPSSESEKEEKNYVLIIDEINRGNVSQIFGELITLIEEDKRLGKDEALEVMLPYSKEKFGVPPNLYIIGTMNTADRSIEALDTALRRRFSFSEMPPKPELLQPSFMLQRLWLKYFDLPWDDPMWIQVENDFMEFHNATIINRPKYEELESENGSGILAERFKDVIKFDGIQLNNLLEIINKRIEVLLDRDHLIGHSYFMQVNSWDDLQEVFYRNIIPLLQEYFFGDYAKIGAVLGSEFVKKENGAKQVMFATGYENEDFSEKEIYRIIDHRVINQDNKFKMDFQKAIWLLLNKKTDLVTKSE
jgi:5-methylcytosine-specific restriction endonuclease McrBC GTP-binding regulatory subunit McrB